jgi:hypothetical protein
MQVNNIKQAPINFKNSGIVAAASFLEENVMLNKAMLDASVDVPFVCLANNKIERKERLRRVSVNYTLCFLSPFLTLPLTNRLAMKHIAKMTPKFMSKEANLIQLSNKYLKNKELTKEGIELLAKEKGTDYSEIIKKFGGDYEKLRKNLINAKNSVLSFDFFFSPGSMAGMAFLNKFLTKKETNMDGYSAEFELADRETIEKRAEKYKKHESLREGIAIGSILALTALPIAVKRGLTSPKNSGLTGYMKKHADKFDYTNGIFMKRLPLFLFTSVAQTGICMASRNQTELKNNALIASTAIAAFFGGDIVINSILSKLSDKFLKTEIIDKSAPQKGINKLFPKTVPIKNLKGKSQKIAAINFFINIIVLAVAYGYGVPKLMNKIVRKDLSKESA